MNSFCCQLDLLTLSAHRLGRDTLERIFFGQIDTKGSLAKNAIIKHGPASLNPDQRRDFAKLIVSLEARRPKSVQTLRRSAEFFKSFFDSTPEVLAAFARDGVPEKPSVVYESIQGSTIEDRILGVVQQITESRKAWRPIADAHWHVLQLGPRDGSFILADRPLIRSGDIKTADAIWILPISPKAAFVAAGHQERLRRVEFLSKFQACREINVASARQAERFVFSIDAQDAQWLSRHLNPRRRT